MRPSVLKVLTLAAFSQAALATPQESATFLAVPSQDEVDGTANAIRTHAFVGGYAARSIRLTGTLSEGSSGSWAQDTRIRVTDPCGNETVLQPFLIEESFSGMLPVPSGFRVDLNSPEPDAAGTWEFRFYEAIVDNFGGVDNTWDTIAFQLDDAATPLLPPGPPSGCDEVQSFAAVSFSGAIDDAANATRSIAWTGTGNIKSVRLTGQVSSAALGGVGGARLALTLPDGLRLSIDPEVSGGVANVGTPGAPLEIFTPTRPVANAGACTLRFFQEVANASESGEWATIALGYVADVPASGPPALPLPPTGDEVVPSFTSVASAGLLGSSANEVRTHTSSGAFSAGFVRATGQLRRLHPLSVASEARVRVGTPSGERYAWALGTPMFTGTPAAWSNLDPQAQITIYPEPAAGTWEFRFFESFLDNGDALAGVVGPDAAWVQFQVALAAAPVFDPPPAFDHAEVEPNNAKGEADAIAIFAPAQVLGGSSMGSATAAGVQSIDYFRFATPPTDPGIYRYTIALKSNGPAGHAGQLRGLSQMPTPTGGVANLTSDVVVQTSVLEGGTQVSRWYGFGGGEEVQWSVVGTGATNAPYYATLSREPVTPGVIAPLRAGVRTISAVGTQGGEQVDTDLWIFAQDFTPIADFGNDDRPDPDDDGPLLASLGSSLTRGLEPGEYWIAITESNLANTHTSPQDDNFRGGDLMELPGSVASSSPTAGVDLSFEIRAGGIDGSVVRFVSASKLAAFDVAWFKLVVFCPADFDDSSGTGTPDGGVGIEDLLYYLALFEAGVVDADVDNGSGMGRFDGAVGIEDLLHYLLRFENGC